MSSKIKVFIYGSCVSRDFLEITDAKNFELIDYFARSSFASIGAKPITDHALIKKIDSKFQRSMVERDLNKSLLNSILKNNFDLLLIDLIDERFSIASIDESFCTVSTEFKKNQERKYKSIAFNSFEKFELWKNGVNLFFDLARKNGFLNKIRISKIFWAENLENGEYFSNEIREYISINNEILSRMYRYIENIINVNQFINYPSGLIVAANEHKWGQQPFHYSNELYFYTKESLEIISSFRGDVRSNLMTSAGKVFPDLLSAYKSIKIGEFFVYKEGVMYPFKWDMTAGRDKPIVFFTPGRTLRGKPMPVFQRSKYFERLKDYNCISCFDPTLFKDEEINLAWFQGERKRFFALELAAIWRDFVIKIKIKTNTVLFFGTSGGGIPGFYLAKSTPDCTLFVSNIQTDIREYDSRTLDKLINVAFDGDEFYVKNASKEKNRFSINGHAGSFNIIYAQNKADVFHYENHYKKWLGMTDLSIFNTYELIEYDDPKTGHGPLDSDAEIGIIRGILSGVSYKDFFPGFEDESLKNQVIEFKYGKFPLVKLTNSIDWNQDPFNNKNWRHHLNSLRWLATLSLDKQKKIVEDFFNFHIDSKKKNPYFNTRTGDHTISIRLGCFCELRGFFIEDAIFLRKIDILVKNDISSLLRKDIYQENNHGLMADVALLRLVRGGLFNSDVEYDVVVARLKNTLDKIFDNFGVCLEHSISYQEYNLIILSEIDDLISGEFELKNRINQIFLKSKEILGSFLLGSGCYMPFGDSFRRPNYKILKKAFGNEDPFLALTPFSQKNGCFFSEAGYFSYRDIVSEINFSFVSGWHSIVHKQNDELSIFLSYLNHIIFDDPGYTDARSWEEITGLKSEKWHSTFWVENIPWCAITESPKKSKMEFFSENPVNIQANSNRQKGVELIRSIKVEDLHITIDDSVIGDLEKESIIRHQFLLKDVRSSFLGDSVCLISNKTGFKICEIIVSVDGEWSLEEAKRVAEDRTLIEDCELIVFRTKCKNSSFKLNLIC